MYLIFTNHAREQIEERKIIMVWVKEAIKWPDYTKRISSNNYIVTKKLNGRSIEVVYIKERYIKVLTVYWL